MLVASYVRTALRINIRQVWQTFRKQAYQSPLAPHGRRLLQTWLDMISVNKKAEWMSKGSDGVPSLRF